MMSNPPAARLEAALTTLLPLVRELATRAGLEPDGIVARVAAHREGRGARAVRTALLGVRERVPGALYPGIAPLVHRGVEATERPGDVAGRLGSTLLRGEGVCERLRRGGLDQGDQLVDVVVAGMRLLQDLHGAVAALPEVMAADAAFARRLEAAFAESDRAVDVLRRRLEGRLEAQPACAGAARSGR